MSLSSSSLLKLFLKKQLSLLSSLSLTSSLSLSSSCKIYIGNEAGDADSIISSLCMAYLRSKKDNNIDSIHLPLVCVNRKDIHLRHDVELLLQSIKLDLNDLICIDDLSITSSNNKDNQENNIKFILLDHNVISNKVINKFNNNNQNINIDNSIEEIIDHHIDGGQYLQCNGKNRNIAWNKDTNTAAVASTCTLVSEIYLSEDQILLDSDISTLLMGVISLDTYNMDLTLGKFTNRDQIIYDELQKRCLNIGIDRNELFNMLINAKTDINFWRSLHPSDQLILDYKLFESSLSKIFFGMSSVLLPVTEFINHIDVLTVIEDYLTENKENKLDILVIMSFVTNPTPTRELLLLSHSEERLQEIYKFIDTNHKSLDLSSIDININMKEKNLCGLAFKQGNLKMTRKQVAPILQQFYDTIKK